VVQAGLRFNININTTLYSTVTVEVTIKVINRLGISNKTKLDFNYNSSNL
jgi:hypothetical protein